MWYTDSNLQYTPALNTITGELTATTDIESAIKVHKALASTEESDRTLSNSIQFLYTLKDGTTFKRNFKNVSPEAYKAVLYLEESEYFKNVFVLITKISNYSDGYHKKIDLTKGDGYYCVNGTYTKIKWSKGNSSSGI